MSGTGTKAEDELPKLHDDEGGESTVAMEAPAIPNGVPLPVSQPPPAAPSPIAPKVDVPAARPAIPLPSAKSSAMMPGPRPPPTRMPTPAAPMPPRGPMPPNRAGGPLPPSGRLGAPPIPPAPMRPSEASVTDTGILSKSATADPNDVEDDSEDDDRDDGPTITTDPGAMIGVADANPFEIDDAAVRAAQSASRPDPRRSPPKQPEPAKPEQKEEDEAATVAVPKDVLERVRANPKAILAEDNARKQQQAKKDEIPSVAEDEEESTRAVPREELLRQQDAHVVVGADAMGDEATVAVAPEANAASVANVANRMPSPTGGPDEVPGFPAPPLGFTGPGPAPGMAGAYPMGHRPMNAPAAMGPGAPPPQPSSAPWQQAQPPPSNMMGPMGGGAVSSGVMPTALPASGQFPGQPQQRMGVMPAQQPQGQQMGWMQQPQQAQAAQPSKSSKISGQVILLVIVGAICLAIFVTGIVLFATTKF